MSFITKLILLLFSLLEEYCIMTTVRSLVLSGSVPLSLNKIDAASIYSTMYFTKF